MYRPSQKSKRRLTRRDFLAMLALGTGMGAAGGLSLGYLLLPSNADSASLPTPTVDPARVARLKTAEIPPIVKRTEWGARPANLDAEEENGLYSLDNPEGYRVYTEELRDIYNTIVIHHSSLYEENDDNTIKAVQNLHMDSRDWADIGYHFCVGKSGTIYEGRKLVTRGTHTEGRNTGTLGICLLGNFHTESVPSPEQLNATQQLVNWVALRLRATHLAGHRDFNSQTVCPGDKLYPSLDNFAQAALLTRGIEGYVPPPEQVITPTSDDETTAFLGTCSCGCCNV